MKDFAVSSITYYDLAREKALNKYPRLIRVLMILALICMTGLAIFLISDLVSFASNPDHEGVLSGLDHKGPESSSISISNEKQNNSTGALIGANSSNLSRMNASMPSSQAAKGVIIAGKSSGSNSAKKHHSSSSSSSAKPTKQSNVKNNLTQENNSSKNEISTNALAINETAKGQTPANQSMNNSQGNESEIANATVSATPENLSQVDLIKNPIQNSSKPFLEEQSSVPSDREGTNSTGSNDSEVQTIANPASLPIAMIQFKTDASASLANADSTTVPGAVAPLESGSLKSSPAAGNNNVAQSSKNSVKNPNSQKSKATVSGQTQKAQQTRAKQIANRNTKKKTARPRSKA